MNDNHKSGAEEEEHTYLNDEQGDKKEDITERFLIWPETDLYFIEISIFKN